MNLKHTFLMSFLMSLFFSATYSMESNSIKDNLIDAIKRLNVTKVKLLVSQGKDGFTGQDLKDIWAATVNHYAKGYRRDARENWGEGKMALLIGAASFFAILGIISYLVKDAKVPEILVRNDNLEAAFQESFNEVPDVPVITQHDVFFSYVDNYAARLFNVLKHTGKYVFSGAAVSIGMYTAIRFGCHLYYKNQYTKFNNIHSFIKSNLPTDDNQ